MGNDIKSMPRTRNTSLDIARVLAIAAVVMIHVSAEFVTGYELGSLEFIWGNLFDGVSRVGVPLFIMTSGALLLDEEKPFTMKDLFTRRLPQMVLLLLAWSAIYAVGYQLAIPLLKGESISLKSFAAGFVSGHYHLWYLYMLAGLYLALPFLRIFVCKKNKNLVILYLAISILFQFTIPVLQALSLKFDFLIHLIAFAENFQLGFFNVFAAYFLTGWYIFHVGVPKKNRIVFYGTAIVALVTMIVYVSFTKDYENAYANSGILVYIYAFGVFLALSNGKESGYSGRILSTLSKSSFGIYVVHVVFMDVINRIVPKTLAAPLYLLICWAFTFAVSLFVTVILSKIPFVKKLVRM